jgi:hypothetical protein
VERVNQETDSLPWAAEFSTRPVSCRLWHPESREIKRSADRAAPGNLVSAANMPAMPRAAVAAEDKAGLVELEDSPPAEPLQTSAVSPLRTPELPGTRHSAGGQGGTGGQGADAIPGYSYYGRRIPGIPRGAGGPGGPGGAGGPGGKAVEGGIYSYTSDLETLGNTIISGNKAKDGKTGKKGKVGKKGPAGAKANTYANPYRRALERTTVSSAMQVINRSDLEASTVAFVDPRIAIGSPESVLLKPPSPGPLGRTEPIESPVMENGAGSPPEVI